MAGDVRVAAFAELPADTAYRLWALRSEVFVVEQDCPYLDLDGLDAEPSTRHLWVERGGAPVATLRLLDEGAHLRIGRVATRAAHRGAGLAAALVDAALALAGERAVASTPSHTSWTGTPASASSRAAGGSSRTASPTRRCGAPGREADAARRGMRPRRPAET